MAAPARSPLEIDAQGRLLLHVKVVPGGARDALLGRLGERLKVKVAAPPEDGAANRAVIALVAGRLALSPRGVTLVSGASSPLKTLCLSGLPRAAAAQALGLD